MKKTFKSPLGGQIAPSVSQTIYSINNFLLTFAGLHLLALNDFRSWFYFSNIYFFTQSICRSTILELYIFGKYSISETRKKVALLTTFSIFLMSLILLSLDFDYKRLIISLCALTSMMILDYLRYISIYFREKILVSQDLVWLFVTLFLLAIRIDGQDYAIFILSYYICGPILSIFIVVIYSVYSRNKIYFGKFSNNLLKIRNRNLSESALLMSNVAVYIVNLIILSIVQRLYETQLLLEIRKVIWITSPVTTFTLILWTYLVANHNNATTRKNGFFKNLKIIIGLLSANLIITAIFFLLFLRSSIHLEILVSTIIVLITITIGQIALPHLINFRKNGSISGIWLSSVVGPIINLSLLVLLGTSVSLIQYNLVYLGSTFVSWILILKTSKKFDFSQNSMGKLQ